MNGGGSCFSSYSSSATLSIRVVVFVVVDGDYCLREVLLPATAWLGCLAALAD